MYGLVMRCIYNIHGVAAWAVYRDVRASYRRYVQMYELVMRCMHGVAVWAAYTDVRASYEVYTWCGCMGGIYGCTGWL